MLYQLVANGINASCVYVLVALGFALIYSTTRFFHFAHGVVFTAGAYLTFLFSSTMRLPLALSVVLAILLTALLGCLIELFIYRPLRRKGSSGLILLLASLGVYIVLQNTISMAFGDDTKSIGPEVTQEGINILGALVTPVQLIIIGVSVSLIVAVAILLKKTKLGQAMRAVANDPALAAISGVRTNAVILWAFAIGSALGGTAGILVALDVSMTPTMGMRALMMAVVVVIIAGRGSVCGLALGALLLGLAQHFGVWKISSQWQDAIAFVILLAFLLFRPEGFMGEKVRKGIV